MTHENDFNLCCVGRVPYLCASLTVTTHTPVEDTKVCHGITLFFNKYDSTYKLRFRNMKTFSQTLAGFAALPGRSYSFLFSQKCY